jgi:hypothetical protein
MIYLTDQPARARLEFPWKTFGRRFTLLDMLKIAAHDWDEVWRELRQLNPIADYTLDMKAHMNKVLVASLEGGSAKQDVPDSLERIASHCSDIGLTLSATYARRSAQQLREAPFPF